MKKTLGRKYYDLIWAFQKPSRPLASKEILIIRDLTGKRFYDDVI